MNLIYDDRDDSVHQRRGSRILYWLDDLDGKPIEDLDAGDERADDGFFFSVAGSISDYEDLVADQPNLRDRAEERLPLMSLASVLDCMAAKSVEVPMSRTWRLAWNEPIPEDIVYPLFVRASDSSLKLGGAVSRVRNSSELLLKSQEIREYLGWDAIVIAREWKDCIPAGTGTYGVLPQEIRVWVVDRKPFAWSFQHLKEIPSPAGFPPSHADLNHLASYAEQVAIAFESRCLVVDFAREVQRGWTFADASAGSSAATDHEGVFKAVASKLIGKKFPFHSDKSGGLI